ncbi:TIGR02302 family protein [Thalassobius vesicularis]|uniref:TIGR02302 family protein n=1 Tax=Thalassobius vesicularis TaxID=1294297 RepID=A0A4S3MCX9_9RHOB|nr:TIGR02302 family protein [Thalassobius vesicularis]THD75940.1 TIGR02302 family protein [Thalassobius vesicularis]
MSDANRRVLRKIRWPLRLTWAGMIAERVTHAFWPVWSVVMLAVGLLMMGVQDHLSVEVVWGLGVVFALAVLGFGLRGALAFRFPRQAEALDRLDAALTGRPIRSMMDTQAIGAGDSASAQLWQVHQARMAARAEQAKPVEPDLRLTRRDPFALRYVAMLGLSVALLFGTLNKVGSVTGMGPGGKGSLAAGPAWEGWIEPPAYTGLPVLYLADQPDQLEIPQGSRVTLRFYGELGALTLAETVSGRVGQVPPASEPAQDFTVAQSGRLAIEGDGGRSWTVALMPDLPPMVAIAGEAETNVDGRMSLPFTAADDYGVTGGSVRISLDMASLDRRYGLTAEPEPRPAITMDLPLPISGSRAEFTEQLIEDFSQHPWAHLPVSFEFFVTDAAGQTGIGDPVVMPLPARRFFDPLAAALIELRRDLLWTRANAPRIAQVMRAISWRPEAQLFPDEADYLQLRVILRRLEGYGPTMTDEQRDELAAALWELALKLEDGDLDDAMERMKRAQERLSEAMKNGASEEEIARLMQELRDATQDYLRQKSRQAQRDQEQMDDGMQMPDDSMQMSMDDLQRMMDRIQELIEQGRMAEAQEAMRQFQEMMENMQMAQQGGQGQNPGDQAMEDLGQTLRDQQGLSDRAFRDLQERFNPGANSGQSQGNEGRNGGMGRGQSHEGQGQGQGSGEAEGEGQGQGGLAEQQQTLRQELERQRGRLPGAGTEGGEAARESLKQAERAMEGAEEALRQDDLAGAIDKQSEAMEAMREGLRNLGEAMAEAGRRQRGGEGQENGNAQANSRDPLGRTPGARGGDVGSDQNLLQGEDVYRRARELLDEIRRRSGEGDRPTEELDYLRRLLDRF